MDYRINLLEFDGDLQAKLDAAAQWLRAHPGATLFIPAGTYTVTTPRARQVMADVLSGAYGVNPQNRMFKADFEYSVGLDLRDCRDVTVSAYGAVFLIDGFMEPVSIVNCVNTHVMGLTVDHLRRPFLRGILTDTDSEGRTAITFDPDTPPLPGMSAPRAYLYNRKTHRLCERFIDWYRCQPKLSGDGHWTARLGCSQEDTGNELYIVNALHFRPAFLISHSFGTRLTDVTVHSQPGMGLVGFKSKDIFITRLRVVPAVGYNMSTNTDATHFACCSGTVSVENSEFYGHGDDALNIHNYYYAILEKSGTQCTVRVPADTETHSLEPDYPETGFRLQLVDGRTLAPVDEFIVRSSSQSQICRIELDHPLPEGNGYLLSNLTETPKLIFRGNRVSTHLARGVLCKTRHAVIENNFFRNCTGTAVHIAAEEGWREGIPSEDVRVAENTFENCGFSFHGRTNGASAVSVNISSPDPTSVGLHKDIVIENNTVRCPESAKYAFNIANAENVTVRGNVCSGGQLTAEFSHCRGVFSDIPKEKTVIHDCE